MSDKKDQSLNPPSQSSCLPIKKRSFAQITQNYSSLDDPQFLRMNKNHRFDFLKKQAYFNVLHAFTKESPAMSSEKIWIVNELKKEWNIDDNTHNAYEFILKSDTMIQQFRDDTLALYVAYEEGKTKTEDMLMIRDEDLAPAEIQEEEEANLGWGKVSPESLVGRWIDIKMPRENVYTTFVIKQYDAYTEMHHLVPILSEKDFEDPCDWVDLRHIPAEDTVWINEQVPPIPVRTCYLEPGQSLLFQTSTARTKKQVEETGKTSTGIPIIKKVDKDAEMTDA